MLAGAVWGVGYASYLPQLTVQTIAVAGAYTISPSLIREYADTILNDGSHHFISRANIFLYPRSVLERAIVGYFPRINAASISRPTYFSTTISIDIEERKTFALWCADESSCYEMDDGGFIFAEAPGMTLESHPGTQYVFEGGLSDTSVASSTPIEASILNPIGRSFVSAHLPGLISLLRFLGQAGYDAKGVVVESDQDFSVPLTSGFTLKASYGEDAQMLARNLQLVLSSDVLQGKTDQLEYVDLRFGDRVYYRLKGESEQTSATQ